MLGTNNKMKLSKVPLHELIEPPISGEWGDDGNEVKVIRNTNFTNEGVLDLSDIAYRKIKQKKIESKKLKYGDIIIEKSGGSPNQPVGRVVYFNLENDTFLCSNFTSVIRNKREVDSRYLFWFLFSNHLNKNTLRYQNKTTGIINLQLSRYIGELQIPLPDIFTQKRIATILDEADSVQKTDALLLVKYDELLQSSFLQLFGDPVSNERKWRQERLGNCLGFLTSGSRGWAKYYSNTGEIFLRINNVGKNRLKLDDIVYVNAPSSAEAIRTKTQVGDILFSITADTGRTAVIPENLGTAYINQHLALLRLKNGFNSYYVSQYLASDGGVMQLQKVNKGGVKIGLNFSDIKSLELLVPPISLQNKFEQIFKNIQEQKEIAQQQQQQGKVLFKSLLQKAFVGEL